MELKSGYKQTEIGVIPDDWEVKTLKEITDPQRPISYGIVQTGPSVNGGVFCLRVIDIQDGQINCDNLITTSEEISFSYKRTLLRADDLVIALRGKIGELAIIGENLIGANLTRGVALIAPLKIYDSYYLYFYLSSPNSKQVFDRNLNGSALQEIPIGTLRKISAPLPPLPEQRAIAVALSDMDNLISAQYELITKKRDIKQATMQQLLTGKKRLPGFSGEWKVTKLGDVTTIKTGKKNNEDKAEDGQYPFYVRSQTVERINTYCFDGEAILVPGEGGIGSIFH